ncbi:loader of DNA helicase [Synechococcus phage ACG-2014a]|uniref:Loader of DNA helicase n=2 Tax=Acionnavirus monteraybay TaxID=2734078 RepID=A0A0E3G6X0_9CAUD|nr:loader of DNA helicase [Synechococcus phage ACG-2014a]AIX15257.1 loader of DNA helicase [Synechococcus phage ACG-2014a]AIX15904.1 loader of DNA helicase [Synechococcus phage ACG-2014a]AIX17015.1 loader of DNA helicase [Synechococcus phage ACG-2014a]AIX20888.1 loader of DNA helicase [Synechococcus phage ACG-2014a]
MTGLEVYKMYLALKMHFTKDSYDYVKYRGKVSASEKSFEERRDRYFFKKLAAKYEDHIIQDYFVANFMDEPKGYIQSFNINTYERWKVNKESFSYKFRQDVDNLLSNFQSPYQDKFDKIFTIEEGQHPILIKSYLSGDIKLETLVVFETCLGYVKAFDKNLKDPIWKEIRRRVIKYKPFLLVDCEKYKSEILTVIRTKL